MKKLFFSSLILIVSLVCLTSCETTAAVTAETPISTEVIWYDTDNNLTVVYIDGIANYRYWDAVYSRYYYRPVPHHRYHYISRRPPMHHHHARPVPPPHRHHPTINHRPNPNVRSHGTYGHGPNVNSSTRHIGGNHNGSISRPSGGNRNGHGGGTHHFGGRR
jgi:hypothetical protein